MTSEPESPDSPPGQAPHRMPVDGERHRAGGVLGVLALGLAVASLVSVTVRSWDAGAWFGLGAGLAAVCGQLVASTSTARRTVLVAFLLALVGVAVSMAHGGLLGVGAAL